MPSPLDPSPVPDPNQALVRATATNLPGHDLATRDNFGSPGVSRTPSVVNGALDGSSFYHAVRRRWLMISLLGLLLGSLAGFGLFLLFPESSTATALFRVRSETGGVFADVDQSKKVDFDVFRATQLQAIKQPTVLNIALNKLGGVKVIAEEGGDDPIGWLDENIEVMFLGDSEYMQVTLTGAAPKADQEAIVNAVCDTYIDEVVVKDRLERGKTLQALEANHARLATEINDKMNEVKQKMKDSNVTDEGSFDPEARILFTNITEKLKEKAKIESEFAQAAEEMAIFERMSKNPAVIDSRIDSQLAADENYAMMKQESSMLQYRLRQAQGAARNGVSRETQRISRELETLGQQMAQYRDQVKQQAASAQATTPDLQLTMAYTQFGIKELSARQQIAKINKEIEEMEKELESKSDVSTDILIDKAEIEQKQAVARDLLARIDAWNIEDAAASDRISRYGLATTSPGINRIQRYAIAMLGGLATLGLTAFGIAYLEFLRRRLNAPSQMDEGLGIRVVGTLPALSARRLADPTHPLVAQLSESIDSVRTALMHESTSKRRQVVLVTSATTGEGRTTVAAQLAASLARAGRRTLLIDGDLRSPSLHSLFGVGGEEGLCEVLRAEADVADLIRPTHAEGLWLLTAGYCDADAVYAMATDQIQPIFEKLRADYDFIIIDGAPVLGLSDSLMVGQHCDGALLCVLRDFSSVPKVHQAAELLRSVGIRLIGSVVNGVTDKVDRRVTHLQQAAPKSPKKQLAASNS